MQLPLLLSAVCQAAAGAAVEAAPNSVAAKAAPPVPCDTSGAKSDDEICDDFCNYRCGFFDLAKGESGRSQNVTVYRITPANTTGIRNKNTGDAIGDVDFYLERKNLTQQCAKDPNSFGCFLDGDNVYGQFTVEIDGQFGPC